MRYTGHDVDSYRTDLLGIIPSMGIPGPVYFGLDNHAAFVDSMAIISKPADETRPRKPWMLKKIETCLSLYISLQTAKIGNPSQGHGGRDITRRTTYHLVKFRRFGFGETGGRMNLHIRRGPFRVNGGIATHTPPSSQSDSGDILSYCSRFSFRTHGFSCNFK